jgi:hypothetical protein
MIERVVIGFACGHLFRYQLVTQAADYAMRRPRATLRFASKAWHDTTETLPVKIGQYE